MQKVYPSRRLLGTVQEWRGPHFGWDLGIEHMVSLILENKFLPFPYPSPKSFSVLHNVGIKPLSLFAFVLSL